MSSGRPREHDRDKIAFDMIEWARKPDSINLCKFCALYDPIIPPSKISIWAKEDDGFRKAYESTKAFLGFRREEKLNNNELHVKAYDLNATTYDFFLKEEKSDQIKLAASIQNSSIQKMVIEVKNDGLGAGLKIPTEILSDPDNQGPE